MAGRHTLPIWALLTASLIGLVLLVACTMTAPGSPSVPPSTRVDASPAALLSPVSAPRTRIAVAHGEGAQHAPFFIALEARAFERYGLDVERVQATGNVGPQALAAGQVAFLVHTGFATAAPMAEGADLVAIAAVIHRHTAQVYGAPGVETPQALRGGRLGIVGPGTLSHLAAHTILRDWGLKPEQDVALLSLRGMPEILTGLLTGAVDAGVLTEPIAFAASKQGLPLIADLRDSPAEYLTTGVFTTREYVRQNRALVLNFLRGYAEGLKRYFDDKPFAIETLRQYVRMDDPVVLDQTYALYAESFFVRIPVPTARGMQHVLDDYAQVNPKAREVDAARLVDASLVQELQREGFFRTLGLE